MDRVMNVVGCGRLGRTLCRLWRERGSVAVGQVLTRSAASARAAVDFVGGGEPVEDFAALRPAPLWLIATGDAAIEAVAVALAASGHIRAGDIAFHCSGALPSSVLGPLATAGAHLASAHPVHSFADPQASLSTFAGSFCALEGEAPAVETVSGLFRAIGARIIAIEPHRKVLYHAGSVIACNYLVALLEASLASFDAAGVPRAQAASLLRPLVHAALDNTLERGAEKALTGPIARGDVEVVEAQYRAVGGLGPEAAALYRVLGRAAAAIARRKGEAPAAALERIEALLTDI